MSHCRLLAGQHCSVSAHSLITDFQRLYRGTIVWRGERKILEHKDSWTDQQCQKKVTHQEDYLLC